MIWFVLGLLTPFAFVAILHLIIEAYVKDAVKHGAAHEV
jgi:hypothetical protein